MKRADATYDERPRLPAFCCPERRCSSCREPPQKERLCRLHKNGDQILSAWMLEID